MGRWIGLVFAATGALLGAGCASRAQVRDEEFVQLLEWLPGEYNNTVQAKADSLNDSKVAHEALALSIVVIDAPVIGTHAYYVQESAADDPRRVMVQRMWTFEATDKGIVQTVWTFAEPLRWRNARDNPDLLKGMMNQDVAVSRGCEITWKKVATHFTASNDSKRCRSNSRATGGTVQIETRMELDSTQLSLAETARDPAGQLVQGRTDEPFYRFRRATP